MSPFRTRLFHLAVGYCLLVASILAPFATEFGYLMVFPLPGPYVGPQLANRVTFWSFMHVQEVLTRVEGEWVVKNSSWLAFSECWDWWGPGLSGILPSSILIPMFALQVVAVLLGLVTLWKATAAKHILPLLIVSLTLNSLVYLAGSHVLLHSEFCIGFWLSILSSASIIVAAVCPRLSMRTPANTGDHKSEQPNEVANLLS